jgi:hypothetical protein
MIQRLAPVFCGMSGVIVGLAFGYCLFSSGTPQHAADELGRDRDRLVSDRGGGLKLGRAAGRRSKLERAGKRDEIRDSDPTLQRGGIRIDWDNGQASFPLSYLQQLELTAFTSEDQSPWASDSDTDAFVISPELNEILQLDASQRDAVRKVLLDAREKHVASRWAEPASIDGDGRAVVIEIAPASAEVENSIRASLSAIMGDNRSTFFLNKIQTTLDWEYGGFGDSRRLVEVSILPDDTISIRESLRHAPGAGGAVGDNPAFELKSRQHRVDQLPASIAALVQMEE